MPRNTHLSLAFAHVGRRQARIIVEVEARACPLRQVQKTHGGCGVLPYLPPQYRTTLPASEAVTDVTDYFSSSPLFFGHRDVQSSKRRPFTSVVQKIALTAILDQAHNSKKKAA